MAKEMEVEGFVSKHVADIVRAIPRLSQRIRSEYLHRAGNALRNYVTTSQGEYSQCKTFLYRNEPKPFYDFYVPSNIQSPRALIKSVQSHSLEQLGNYILILGTAGSGKSTLMRHLFLDSVRAGVRLPIFFELRRLEEEQTLFDAIYDNLNLNQYDLPKEFLKRLLMSENTLLLLDGFDEVQLEKKSDVAKQIHALSKKYVNCRIVVSSRPEDQFGGWHRFVAAKVQPLSKTQAIELVQKLHYDAEVKDRFLQELKDRLYDEHTDFLSNPLLLIIMLLNYHENAAVPSTKHVFYGQVFATLYNKHDALKEGYVRQILSKLPIDRFERVLSAFAIQGYLQGKLVYSHSELLDYLGVASNQTGLEFNKELFIEDLLRAVCILQLDGLQYRFTHRTFQEYFAARFAVTQEPEVQAAILDRGLPGYTSNEFLVILFGLAPDLVESHIILPRLQSIIEKSGDEKEPTETGFFKLFEQQYGAIDIGGDESGGIAIVGSLRILAFIRILREIYGRPSSARLGWVKLVGRLSELEEEESSVFPIEYAHDPEVRAALLDFDLFSFDDYSLIHELKATVAKRMGQSRGMLEAILGKTQSAIRFER